jgi:hypothetical protein
VVVRSPLSRLGKRGREEGKAIGMREDIETYLEEGEELF